MIRLGIKNYLIVSIQLFAQNNFIHFYKNKHLLKYIFEGRDPVVLSIPIEFLLLKWIFLPSNTSL